MRIASRMDVIGTETAFEAAARARALEATGRSVIHLEIGEPDFDTPANIREAAKRAIDDGFTHYGPYFGLPKLREAIAADASTRKRFPVSPDHVIVTPGAKPIMYYAMIALIEPGDEVIVPDPGYPIYASMAKFAGGTVVPLPIRQELEFRADLDELESLVTKKTRMLVLNSPANPTGGLFTREDIVRIAELALRHDLIVLADEIYGRIVYEGEHVSIASIPGMAERTIVLDGFSKTYAMTGWRLGYAVLPDVLLFPFSRLIINSVSCTSTFSQVAAIEALNGPQDEIDAMVAEFKARRDLIVDGLNAIPGIKAIQPHAAFYVFPEISGTGLDGAELADRLLNEVGVCVLAGTAFGEQGVNHIRISYANSRANLTEALARIRQVVEPLVAARS
ncbi:MAG: pyridoxal phosphate-dependent aminotransferase [Dehalococcoidia bacterium]